MYHKIDCNNTVDYLKTRAAATKINKDGYYQTHCDDCVLKNQMITKRCEVLEYLYPEKAIEILQDYADRHLNHDDIFLDV